METHHWNVEEATVSLSPKNVNATMEVKAQATYNEKLESLSAKKELFSMAVPELGFEIDHVIKLGVTLAYQVGFNTKLLGSATLVFGATSSLPDEANILVDLLNNEATLRTGFEDAALVPVFDITALTTSVKFAVFTQADIAFGIELNKIGKFDVELNLKIPQLSVLANAGYRKHLHHRLSTKNFALTVLLE